MFLESNEQVSNDEVQVENEQDYIHIKRSHFNFLLLAILVPFAFLIGISSGYLIWGGERVEISDTVSSSDTVSPAETEEILRFEIPIDGEPYIGPEDAPIVIVEFSDFNCTYCRRFHQETFDALLEKYPDQIRFVYRDFPITSQESFYAAQAAQCAFEQDKFWEFHDLLFSGEFPLGSEAYETYALELGLDSEELLICIESERYAGEVSSDGSFATNLGLTGTPSFFINGIPMIGAQPLSQFVQIIDEELSN
jgi:protein-disulfide isomerase